MTSGYEFTGKVALVTGACGGIGSSVVHALAAQGAVVAAADLDGDGLTALADGLQAKGGQVSPCPVDITSSRAVDALVDDVEQTLGPIEFLVNVAGVLRPAPVVAITDDDWGATFRVNANGVLHACRAVVPRMMQRHSGAIVTVASNASAVPRVGMGAYVASKAAATAFTKNLALEVARYGIRCNVVAPGSTETPMLRALWFGADGQPASAILEEHAKFNALDGRMDQFRVGIPLGKLAQPVDVAEAVLFLLSDRASHITMQDLQVDGGAALGA